MPRSSEHLAPELRAPCALAPSPRRRYSDAAARAGISFLLFLDLRLCQFHGFVPFFGLLNWRGIGREHLPRSRPSEVPRLILPDGRGIPARGLLSVVRLSKIESPEGLGAGSGLGFPLRPEPHAPSTIVGKRRGAFGNSDRPWPPKGRLRPIFTGAREVFRLFSSCR